MGPPMAWQLGVTIEASRLRAGLASMIDCAWALSVVFGYVILHSQGSLTIQTAIIWYAVTQVFASGIYLILLKPVLGTVPLGRRSPQFQGWPSYWLNAVLSTGLGKSSDMVIMSLIGAAAAELGQYNAAFTIATLASVFLLQGAGTMTYVSMGMAFSSDTPGAVERSWRASILVAGLLSFPSLLFCIAFPAQSIRLLYGPGFGGGAAALVILCLCLICSRVLGGGANQGLLYLHGRERVVLWIRGTAVVANLALDIALFPVLGIEGVAISSGGAAVLIAFAELVAVKRLRTLRLPLGQQFRLACCFAVSVAIARVAWSELPGGGISLVMAALGTGGVGLLLLLVVRPLDQGEFRDVSGSRGRRLQSMASRIATERKPRARVTMP